MEGSVWEAFFYGLTFVRRLELQWMELNRFHRENRFYNCDAAHSTPVLAPPLCGQGTAAFLVPCKPTLNMSVTCFLFPHVQTIKKVRWLRVPWHVFMARVLVRGDAACTHWLAPGRSGLSPMPLWWATAASSIRCICKQIPTNKFPEARGRKYWPWKWIKKNLKGFLNLAWQYFSD